jgi:NAD(P)-dependent dehydrogenase (short-subunit alcohol dehydrogenase family)
MRPVTDTVVLVTGATDGLGRAVAGALAARGAVVHLHGRSPERLAATVDEIRAATPGARLTTHVADLASLAEVRRLGDEVAELPALHVLVNNAGVGGVDRQLSQDGHELHLAVNHLAGFALTRRLLPLLEASAPARIVFVASVGQAPLDFDDPMLERGYQPLRAYGQSKLAQIATSFTLAERLDPARVTVNSLHPATLMPTKMVRDGFGRTVDDLQTGVDATVRLAIGEDVEGVSGRFYDRQRESRPDAWALDPDNRRRLWELSERLTT